MHILAVIIIAVVVCIALGVIRYTIGADYVWGKNPHRRYCKACGQQQDEYYPTGWAAMGEIKDPNCRCHKDCHG